MRCSAAGDHWFDPACPQQPPVLVVVIATIGEQHVRLMTRPTGLSGDRTAREIVKQRDQLGDVVAMPASQSDRERDTAGVDKEMVFGARSSTIYWG